MAIMEAVSSIKTKFPNAGTTIFTIMSKMAQDYGAINLSQGFPDFEVSPKLIKLVKKSLRAGYNQYAPMPGDMQLRERIAEKTQKLYSSVYHPETEITVTAGATQAIFTAICSIINEGDEAILFSPAYDCYVPPVQMLGGKPKFVQLKHPNYSIDWDEVKKIINRKTKLIIINTPHNPTGSVLSAYDIQMLEKITKGTDIIILSDEVYEHQLFDGHEHQSVARFPELAKRTFICSSFGKTFHATGWKLGYCLAPADLMKEFRKVHQYTVFAVNHPMQKAMAEFISDEENYLHVKSVYQEKRNLFLSFLKDTRFEFIPSSGTYFQLLDYSKITDEKDVAFAERLTKENKIASIPVSVFYHVPIDYNVLRFCFAKKNETLEQAAEILCKI